MKRIDEVTNYIYSVESAINQYDGYAGISTQDIANALNLRRNNVSSLLNDLIHQRTVLKTKSRPVCYISQKLIQRLDLTGFIDDENIIHLSRRTPNQPDLWSFSQLIGEKGSLYQAIETAKAAIAYPPYGLHSIIFGESGVGKTLFAHCMHGFYQQRSNKRVPFVHFNCADYHQNPQLLLSHLFGHVKGAYSGADQEREGLVAKANGGILFLDEIHRLPPDGQEMLFSLIDNKTYSKLGSEVLIPCQVLLISATTASPEKALLKTFLRRIPVTITLPKLSEKSTDELFELIRHLFSRQAVHINRDILVKKEVLASLIEHLPSGAIGQLSSDIKQTCANALLLDESHSELLVISNNNLPLSVTKTFQIQAPIYDVYFCATGESPKLTDSKAIQKWISIGESECGTERHSLMGEYYAYLHSIYNYSKKDRRKLNDDVESNLIQLSEKLVDLVCEAASVKEQQDLVPVLSIHLQILLYGLKTEGLKADRLETDEEPLQTVKITDVVRFDKVRLVCHEHHVLLSDVQICLLLALIVEASCAPLKQRIGCIVICHGTGVASNIARVCNTLMGTTLMQSMDIPLEHSLTDYIHEIKSGICSLDQGKGVAILADMGSTTTVAQLINQATGIATVCFSHVSTPMALEVLRRILYEDKNIEELAACFDHELKRNTPLAKKEVVLSICTTGVGSSDFITQKLQNIITLSGRNDVNVVTLKLAELQQGSKTFDSVLRCSNILFAVGTVAPELDVPFYSISELFSHNSESTFIQLLNSQTLSNKTQCPSVYEQCFDILSDYIMYLNPKQVVQNIKNYLDGNDYLLMLNDDVKLKLILHISGMVERLTHKSNDAPISVYAGDFSLVQVRQNIDVLERAYKIEISDIELSYIAQIANQR